MLEVIITTSTIIILSNQFVQLLNFHKAMHRSILFSKQIQTTLRPLLVKNRKKTRYVSFFHATAII